MDIDITGHNLPDPYGATLLGGIQEGIRAAFLKVAAQEPATSPSGLSRQSVLAWLHDPHKHERCQRHMVALITKLVDETFGSTSTKAAFVRTSTSGYPFFAGNGSIDHAVLVPRKWVGDSSRFDEEIGFLISVLGKPHGPVIEAAITNELRFIEEVDQQFEEITRRGRRRLQQLSLREASAQCHQQAAPYERYLEERGLLKFHRGALPGYIFADPQPITEDQKAHLLTLVDQFQTNGKVLVAPELHARYAQAFGELKRVLLPCALYARQLLSQHQGDFIFLDRDARPLATLTRMLLGDTERSRRVFCAPLTRGMIPAPYSRAYQRSSGTLWPFPPRFSPSYAWTDPPSPALQKKATADRFLYDLNIEQAKAGRPFEALAGQFVGFVEELGGLRAPSSLVVDLGTLGTAASCATDLIKLRHPSHEVRFSLFFGTARCKGFVQHHVPNILLTPNDYTALYESLPKETPMAEGWEKAKGGAWRPRIPSFQPEQTKWIGGFENEHLLANQMLEFALRCAAEQVSRLELPL